MPIIAKKNHSLLLEKNGLEDNKIGENEVKKCG